MIKNLDSPVTIYTFLNEQNGAQADQISNLLKEYQQVGKNIVVEKIDPAYDTIGPPTCRKSCTLMATITSSSSPTRTSRRAS